MNIELEVKSLKIGSYNIKHGSDNGRYCEGIGKLLRENDLDIIGIQEIDCFVNRSGNIDVLKEIASAGNYHYYKFYKTINYQNGDYGLGIISKYPFETISVTKLSHCKEQRLIVLAEVDINGFKMNFLVTHFELGTYEDVRKFQFIEVKNILKDLKYFVLTGDFNVQNWNEPGNFFEIGKHFDDYKILNNPHNTFLSYSGKECIGGGILPIDNIIVSNNIDFTKTYMVDTDYSDHDLLIGEISLSLS